MKYFIANKINTIAKASVHYSFRSFARANRAKLVNSQQKPADKALNVQIV